MAEVKTKGTGWGGKRIGAGRKPSTNVRVTFTLPRKVWLELQALAAAQSQAPEVLVGQWLQEKLKNQK